MKISESGTIRVDGSIDPVKLGAEMNVGDFITRDECARMIADALSER